MSAHPLPRRFFFLRGGNFVGNATGTALEPGAKYPVPTVRAERDFSSNACVNRCIHTSNQKKEKQDNEKSHFKNKHWNLGAVLHRLQQACHYWNMIEVVHQGRLSRNQGIYIRIFRHSSCIACLFTSYLSRSSLTLQLRTCERRCHGWCQAHC